MAQILDGESVEAWKARLRGRIMENLDVMLQDAAEAYQRKIADNAAAPTELLYQFQSRYNLDVRNLQEHAEEQLKIEIAREERERTWASATTWDDAGDVTQSLVEEQLAILSGIKSASPRSESHFGVPFEQESARFPTDFYPSPERSSSTTSSNLSLDAQYARYEEYPTTPIIQTVKIQTAADREARARAEKHEHQQEEFRKRAQAILQRKQKERQWPDEPPLIQEKPWSSETMSSSSSTTSASDQEPAFGSDSALFKAENPMSAEDVANLMLFHLQQWTWILTLPHIQWADFPWPLLSFSAPRRVEDLTLEAVAEYVFAPLHVRVQQDNGVPNDDRARVKDRLKDLIRRWHPDRFEIKYLARVADLHEREMVRQGAGIVARVLNDLLGKWNDL